MESLHKHLLGLLHEIDDICRKYDITYYAAGGTAIGAARHKGFIPWDDDADLYMTRENFYRFRDAFYKEDPKDRVLECIDDNPQCPATIPRYIEETTTTLCRFHCMNTCSGGLIIDVFILDPIPDEPKKQEEYLAKFNIYNDLVVPYYVYSQRNITEYYHLYDYYMKKVKRQGREAVLRELEAELFQYKEDECNFYALRWGSLPSIFPKDMIGDPVYLPFEDMEMPVPQKWWDYLHQLYGADWIYIPTQEEARQHVSVVNMDLPYTVYTSEMDRLIDKKEAAQNYQLRKDLKVKEEKLRRSWYEILLEVNANYVLYVQNKIISKNNYDLPKMMEAGDFSGIINAFSWYLDNQCMPQFIGSMKHSSWYRYRSPIFIQLDDSFLYFLLYALIAIGQSKKADRILTVRKFTKEHLTTDLQHIDELLEKLKTVCNSYYSDRKADAKETLNSIADEDMQILDLKRIGLLLAVENAESEMELHQLEGTIKSAIEENDEDGEILKAYGDLLYKLGKVDKAKAVYGKVQSLTRNGMLLLDIEKKVGNLDNNIQNTNESKKRDIQTLSPFEQAQLNLLKEIDDICNENGIEYYLHGKTAVYAYRKHTFGKDYEPNSVSMTAQNAIRFINVFNKEDRKNRGLHSMLTDANHLFYDLYYFDRSTLYYPLSESARYKGMGIFVRIRILRKKDTNRLKNYFIRSLEFLHESYIVSVSKNSRLSTRIMKRFGSIIMRLCGERGRTRLANHLFVSISDLTIRSKMEEYFVTKGNRGLKHKNEVYPIDFFERKENVILYDHSFPMPAYIAEKTYKKDSDENTSNIARRGVFRFIDAYTSFAEFEKNVDLTPLLGPNRIDFEKSQKYVNQIRSVNKQISRYWAIVCRIDDTMKMQEKYGPLKSEINDLYQKKNYDEILDILFDYDELVSYYLSFNMGFYFDEELLGIYCECLKQLEKQSKADKLMNYVTLEGNYQLGGNDVLH